MPAPLRLFCERCRAYQGEIRDATLRKDLVFLCGACDTKRKAVELSAKADPIKDFLGGIFGK